MSAGFQCKKFYVAHDQCAMKVGTDGLLLGAFAPLPQPGRPILDIGTGSGLISLMLAQRSCGANPIDAIELDNTAALQAATNIANSPWPTAVQLIKGDILTYQSNKRYSLIVSNPPFFQQALPATDARRHQARHTDSLPFARLLEKAKALLVEEGVFAVVLPLVSAEIFCALAQQQGWFVSRYCAVKATPNKPILRALLCLRLQPSTKTEYQLIITAADGSYSQDYKALLKDFYLKF